MDYVFEVKDTVSSSNFDRSVTRLRDSSVAIGFSCDVTIIILSLWLV